MTKKYVSVVVEFNEIGVKKPISINYNNTVFYVDKVIGVKNCASLKVGGIGEMYTIMILGKQTVLFFEQDKWFVEAKN